MSAVNLLFKFIQKNLLQMNEAGLLKFLSKNYLATVNFTDLNPSGVTTDIK